MSFAQKSVDRAFDLKKRTSSHSVIRKHVAVQPCELWVLDRLLPKVESEQSSTMPEFVSESSRNASFVFLPAPIGSYRLTSLRFFIPGQHCWQRSANCRFASALTPCWLGNQLRIIFHAPWSRLAPHMILPVPDSGPQKMFHFCSTSECNNLYDFLVTRREAGEYQYAPWSTKSIFYNFNFDG